MNKQIINELLKITCPFPFVNLNDNNKGLNDGFVLQSPSICKKKFSKNCKDFYSSIIYSENLEHHTCPHGFSIFTAICNDIKIINTGLISFPENKDCPKQFRKTYSQNKVASEKINYWFNHFKNIIPSVEATIQDRTKAAIAILHDIQKTNSLIKSNAEALISKQKGGTSFEDKFENSPDRLKSIYKASELLSNQMELINLFSNPAMITAGKKRLFEVFRFFDKIRILYLSKTKNKNCRITLVSPFSSSLEAYDSFSLLPHILIDNAVKYSQNNESITVQFSENKDDITTRVVSVGPMIEEDEKTSIFEMYYKGKNSFNYSSEGSGIGLYVAKCIVKGHGGEIYVTSVSKNTHDKDVPLAVNTFTLIVPKKLANAH